MAEWRSDDDEADIPEDRYTAAVAAIEEGWGKALAIIEGADDPIFTEAWVLVASVVKGDGDRRLIRFSPRDVGGYKRSGLLHEALYGWGD